MILPVLLASPTPMANFSQAFAKTLGNEGGYSTDPKDLGGETYCGISRVNFPDWAGWHAIDAWKGLGSPSSVLGQNEDLQAQVQAFYRSLFWNPLHGDQIAFPDLAEKLFDMAVNMGIGQAVKLLQDALNVVVGSGLTVDGGMGPMTLAALNSLPATAHNTLRDAISINHGGFYMYLIRQNPSQRVFVNGWLTRAME